MRVTFTIGYIPRNWNGSADGLNDILIGDADYSNTIENEYEVTDESFINLSNDDVINGSMDETYKRISEDTFNLSLSCSSIPAHILANIYEFCLEETGDLDSNISLYQEDMDHFTNDENNYNGCFYCRYIVEDDGIITREVLFVLNDLN